MPCCAPAPSTSPHRDVRTGRRGRPARIQPARGGSAIRPWCRPRPNGAGCVQSATCRRLRRAGRPLVAAQQACPCLTGTSPPAPLTLHRSPPWPLDDQFFSADGTRACFRFVIHYHNTGTFYGHPPTGERGTMSETHAVRLRDGRISEQVVGDNNFSLPHQELVSWGMDFPRDTPDPVPVEYVRASTTEHTPGGFPEEVGYGYHWWVTTVGCHHAYFDAGYGGQYIFVVLDLDLVAVATARCALAP